MSAETVVIGIDIAVTKAITMAAKHSLRNWDIVACDATHHKVLGSQLSNMKLSNAATHAAIEQPYVGPNKRGSLELARVYGRIEVICEQLGLIVIAAPVDVWQRAMLTPCGTRLGGRKQRKALSMLRAKAEGADVANDDEADAVCISKWLAMLLRLKELEQEVK